MIALCLKCVYFVCLKKEKDSFKGQWYQKIMLLKIFLADNPLLHASLDFSRETKRKNFFRWYNCADFHSQMIMIITRSTSKEVKTAEMNKRFPHLHKFYFTFHNKTFLPFLESNERTTQKKLYHKKYEFLRVSGTFL